VNEIVGLCVLKWTSRVMCMHLGLENTSTWEDVYCINMTTLVCINMTILCYLVLFLERL
jgi:hypothetical protein